MAGTRTFSGPGFVVCLTAVIAAGLAMVGAGVLSVATFWVHRSAGPHIYHGIAEVPARDVAIVPGVGTGSRRTPRHLLDRLAPALALYRAGKVGAILVSGIGLGPDRDEVTTMVRYLLARGVPPDRILSDPAGYRTLDTMQRATRVLNVGSAIICTQGIFMPRALFLARAAGIDAVGLSVPSPIKGTSTLSRNEAMKTGLAFVDTYLIDRNPRYLDTHGARIGQQMRPAFKPVRLAGP